MKSKSKKQAKSKTKNATPTRRQGKVRVQAVAATSAKKSSSKNTSKASSKKTTKMDSNDIIQIILQDHKPLKELIKVLKTDGTEFLDKKPVFEEFAPLLLSHSEPEEQSLYVHMKEEQELRAEGFEGQTEHALASQLIEDINQTSDEDEWMAKVKVLAEMVENHIEEEEELFPDIRKLLDSEERIAIGEEYVRLRDDYRMENAIPVTPSKKSDDARIH